MRPRSEEAKAAYREGFNNGSELQVRIANELAVSTREQRLEDALRWALRVVHTAHNPLDINKCEWPICKAGRAALDSAPSQPSGKS